MAKPVRVGLRQGGGPEPGYLWSVLYLSSARAEAGDFLTESQYAHVVDLMRALAREPQPTHPRTVDVRAVEDFWEIRDKGGILGKVNLRVFFVVNAEEKQIIVLGAINKSAEGQTPTWAKIRIRRRIREHL